MTDCGGPLPRDTWRPREAGTGGRGTRGPDTVYVHCNAGVNRSPSTVIAYLHWIRRQELGEAVWMVTSRHACDPYVTAIVQATQVRHAMPWTNDESQQT